MDTSGKLEFVCPTPGCGHRYRLSVELVGKTIQCKSCHQKVKLSEDLVQRVPAAGRAETTKSESAAPAAVAAAPRAARQGPAAAPPDRLPSASAPVRERPPTRHAASPPVPHVDQVECPSCHSACRIRPEWRGKQLECPTCKQRFVVPAFAAVVAQPAGAASDDGFFVEDAAEASGMPGSAEADSPAFDILEQELAAPPVMLSPSHRPASRRRTSDGLASFTEWVQGPGVWILAGVGFALLVLSVFLIPLEGVAAAAMPFARAGALCGATIVIAIVTLLGAAALRLACSACDVDPLDFGRCLAVAFVGWMTYWLTNTVTTAIVNPETFGEFALGIVVCLTLWATASGAWFMVSLDTTFAKGLVMWLAQLLVLIALCGVLGCVVGIIILAGAGRQLSELKRSPAVGVPAQQAPQSPLPQSPLPTQPIAPPMPQPGATGGSRAGTEDQKFKLTISNGKLWRTQRPGLGEISFTLDYRHAGGSPEPGVQYAWLLTPTRGRQTEVLLNWPDLMQPSGTLEGSVHLDPGETGPYQSHIEVRRIGGFSRSGEKISNTITMQETSPPPQESSRPPGVPDFGRPNFPGGLPGGPSNFPSGMPSGPPGGFPRGPRGPR